MTALERLRRLIIPAMGISLLVLLTAAAAGAQTTTENEATLKLALPDHPGQLRWRARGFRVVESSAKANGREMGIRGSDGAGLEYLAFLFVVPGETSLTGAKCRASALNEERKNSPSFQDGGSSEMARPGGLSVALSSYSARDNSGKTWHAVRAFTAASDICGDIEFYTPSPMDAGDPRIKSILNTFELDPAYVPQFRDVLLYAQILYQTRQYRAAAPIFEQALKMVDNGGDRTWRRVVTDQAGMSYGISGNIAKAREIFTAAIVKDPDYPLFYYNLACADAEENKLAGARLHLQQAFARKGNLLPGESMPDPAQDDSFLPHRRDKEFWEFVTSLH